MAEQKYKEEFESLQKSLAVKEQKRCEVFLQHALQDRKIMQLLNSLKVYGCNVTEQFFKCRKCYHNNNNNNDNNINGNNNSDYYCQSRFYPQIDENDNRIYKNGNGYKIKQFTTFDAPFIQLCTNDERLFSNLSTFRSHLTHELILTFDWCRIDINYNNCDEIACSQIRATTMSGECNPFEIENIKNRFDDTLLNNTNNNNNTDSNNNNNEQVSFSALSTRFGRSNSGQGLRCIRKNAALNIDQLYPHCHSNDNSGKTAWQSINNAWIKCFRDYDPFYDKQNAW